MRSFVCSIAILSCVGLAAAQNFGYNIIFASPGPFRAGCESDSRLPPGTPVFIFWDANGDGPDAEDNVPCSHFRMCIPEWPYVDEYSFPLTGNGLFISPVISGSGPTNGPFLVYLRIFFGFRRDSCWTSPTLYLTPSQTPQTIFIAGHLWTCGPAAGARSPCEPHRRGYMFDLDESAAPVCYYVCGGVYNNLAVTGGGITEQSFRPPVIRVDGGCGSGCAPSLDFQIHQQTWEISSYSSAWVLYPGITAGDFGCVTLTLLDSIPCARLDTMTARREIGTVALQWNTVRETTIDSFVVWRAFDEFSPWNRVGAVTARGLAGGADYALVDNNAPHYYDEFLYNLLMIDREGREWPAAHIVIAGAAANQPDPGSTLPATFALEPVYPNPFNAAATVRLRMDAPATVTIMAYDVLGRAAAIIAHGPFAAGSHSLTWNAAELPSGLYFIEAKTAFGARAVQKAALLK